MCFHVVWTCPLVVIPVYMSFPSLVLPTSVNYSTRVTSVATVDPKTSIGGVWLRYFRTFPAAAVACSAGRLHLLCLHTPL